MIVTLYQFHLEWFWYNSINAYILVNVYTVIKLLPHESGNNSHLSVRLAGAMGAQSAPAEGDMHGFFSTDIAVIAAIIKMDVGLFCEHQKHTKALLV